MLKTSTLERMVKPYIGSSKANDVKEWGLRVVTFANTGYVSENTSTQIASETTAKFKKIGYSLVKQPKKGEYKFTIASDDIDEDGFTIGTLELIYIPVPA